MDLDKGTLREKREKRPNDLSSVSIIQISEDRLGRDELAVNLWRKWIRIVTIVVPTTVFLEITLPLSLDLIRSPS